MTRGGQTQLLGASGRNVREPPWSGRPTFSSASGQDLRRRANSEMYHGFTIDLLVELVRSELATAQAERVVAGGRAMENCPRADHGRGAAGAGERLLTAG